MTQHPLSVVLAGGGTAGHISPLLAIADAVTAQRPDSRITVVGTASGMETRLVPAAGYELATIDRVPMPRRPSADLVKLPARLVRAVKQAGAILDAAQADVVVGVGGYVSTPVYLAARRRSLPVIVHEANARPGLANRVGARFAAVTGVAFEATSLPKATWVGMPMRREISSLDRNAARAGARAALGLKPDMPTLVVTGGSSGAASINRAVEQALPALAAAGIQTLHITGRGKSLLDAAGRPLAAPGYTQVEYVDGMETAYAAADLLLARSGAGTVCETSAVGLPAVLVPLPHGNGEQALNAEALVSAGGALTVADPLFTAEWISGRLIPLLADPAALDAMSRASSSLGIRDADQRMAAFILEASDRSKA
ncbi:undecaprenyldiphospho-muramoylpentapeptide beta-N-acetylglucosaminyltransferase [Arthrobacter sp. zg-Y750]|uniref:undecaprenyldiphospho-muramoylpentapeptide beta-N-acetylglucosaminyltransferase n=1 Tax=Arthrobacter sp. zg-Y750 TaxID=2894189 RepID=UPI001E3049ED|nr:undecaprenyldiphospho-muramoylpentapeptide beta-N-acetylglucosaminyltransferase [Arthrobacter sp. zg-Y750]MCC9178086.1 undecaprenyldiphospho-muramoylpentapeptide beta-N-acetylglucosaminyltransferase [Arthrobacter sp. zg-Y750]